MLSHQAVAQLSNSKVLSETRRLAACEQAATADLVVMLAELDARKLYFEAGFNSLFSFCTDELHLSEDAAYTRIEVARISREFPMVLELVSEGSLSVTNARLLIPVLTHAAQCAFEGPQGRCPERNFLEFHHLRPFAEGGSTCFDNLELRCRAHNVYEAELMVAD